MDIYFDGQLTTYDELAAKLAEARDNTVMGVTVTSSDIVGGVISDGTIEFTSGAITAIHDIKGALAGVYTATGQMVVGGYTLEARELGLVKRLLCVQMARDAELVVALQLVRDQGF